MKQYLIAIDFASKLGWSIWNKQTFDLINVGFFDFDAKEYKKLFQNSKFQQNQFEKVVFEQESAKKLIQSLFNQIQADKDSEIDFVIEYSDFGFKYTVARIMRLLSCFLIELNQFNLTHNNCKLKVNTIIAVTWRKAFADNNKDFDYSKYETKSKNNRKRINWKPLAKDWVVNFVKNHEINIDEKLLYNNDITDSIIIGWTYLNWMDQNKLQVTLKPLIKKGEK